MPIALVTGGSRGIGAAAARLAAARGYAVALCYRSAGEAAARVVDEIERAGGRALALRADVSREEEVVELFARLDRELGRLDALVNNAGVLEPQTRLEGIDAHRLARVLGVNVIGSFLCAREAVKRMSTLHGGKGGAIVNLSSAAARLGSPVRVHRLRGLERRDRHLHRRPRARGRGRRHSCERRAARADRHGHAGRERRARASRAARAKRPDGPRRQRGRDRPSDPVPALPRGRLRDGRHPRRNGRALTPGRNRNPGV